MSNVNHTITRKGIQNAIDELMTKKVHCKYEFSLKRFHLALILFYDSI
jgi:hypothetical protein